MSEQVYKPLSPSDIATLRGRLGWTQVVMGQYLKVTARTIGYWEAGTVEPSDYQMAMLQILRDKLEQAHKNSRTSQFKEKLNNQLPAILFGIGIVALFAFLFSEDNDADAVD